MTAEVSLTNSYFREDGQKMISFDLIINEHIFNNEEMLDMGNGIKMSDEFKGKCPPQIFLTAHAALKKAYSDHFGGIK